MVRLEPMAERHFDQTFEWLSGSAELRRQIDSVGVPTREGNIDYWRRNLQDRSREDWAIITPDGRHVGNCGLVKIDRQSGSAEMWIYLGQYRGAGLGSAALDQLLNRAFDGLGLTRVTLRVVEGNDRAIAFYQRAGFSINGLACSDERRDGRRVHSTLMSIVKHERRAKRVATR